MQDIEKSSTELLWALSDGTKTDMDAWKRTEVMEFYMGLWVHQDLVTKRINKLKNNNSDGD